MKQDVVADALNMIMNAKRVEKKQVEINRSSKLLLNVLEMMKTAGYIDYKENKKDDGKDSIIIDILKLNYCRAIKPRYSVTVERLDKYLRRYLPSRNFGTLIVSTNKGLMTHQETYQNKLGGSLIAYFY